MLQGSNAVSTDPPERNVKILVVDDEAPARERLVAMVAEIGIGAVCGEAANGAVALELAARTGAQIILLDIRMPGMDGLEAARHLATLDAPPAVIFTTAYDTHALAAFEANAVDYLLKPIRAARLREALQRARAPTRAQLAGLGTSGAGQGNMRTHISATQHGDRRLVPVADIRYLRAEHKYVTVGYPGGEVLIEDALNTLEDEFGDRFLRVHRNALVASAHVTALEKTPGGQRLIRLDGVEATVEVSRRLAATVKRALR